MQPLKTYEGVLVSVPPCQNRPVVEGAGKAAGTSGHLTTAS